MKDDMKAEDYFIKGAEKQREALQEGGWGHAIWCNYITESEYCNCGIADIQRGLEQQENGNSQLQALKEEVEKMQEYLYHSTDSKTAEIIDKTLDDVINLITNLEDK